MIKQLGLALLWFLAAWTCAAMAVFFLGLPGWVVPALAVTAAILAPSLGARDRALFGTRRSGRALAHR